MAHVAVVGEDRRAAEWATRFLASGLDVVVADVSTVAPTVEALWPEADRLGLFPGSSLARLRAGGDDDLRAARFVQVVEGAAPAGCAGIVATEATARGCSPVHLVPLVEVAGSGARALAGFYRSIGMAPVDATAPAHERWQLGEGLVELTDGEPDALIAVMRALRPSGKGAGAAMAHHEAVRYASGAVQRWQVGDVPDAPLRLYRTPVEPEWVDYNGHMTEAAYLTAAGWASDALFRYIGDDEGYRAAGHSFYTVETHVHFLREVDVHEPIEFTTQILGVDAKRVHLLHSMLHGADGGLLATAEQMLLHVDMHAGRTVPILPGVAAALEAIGRSHSSLPTPPQVGTVMRLPARPNTHHPEAAAP
jgi:carnitine 3-dehydrogenase